MSNTNQTKPNTRFNVGEVEYFIDICYEIGDNRFVGASLYLPWVDKLKFYDVVELTCTEHHKVAWDQDPAQEAKYDGFVFTDKNELKYHNQYPTASYGQLDDSCDWTVRPDIAADQQRTDDHRLFGPRYQYLTSYISDLMHGIARLQEENQHEKVDSLKAWKDKIEQQMISQFNMKFKSELYKNNEARTSLKLYVTTLVPAPKRKTLEQARAETEALNKLARDMRGDLEVEKF